MSAHALHMWGTLHELVTRRNVLGRSCNVTIYLSTCKVHDWAKVDIILGFGGELSSRGFLYNFPPLSYSIKGHVGWIPFW